MVFGNLYKLIGAVMELCVEMAGIGVVGEEEVVVVVMMVFLEDHHLLIVNTDLLG